MPVEEGKRKDLKYLLDSKILQDILIAKIKIKWVYDLSPNMCLYELSEA